MNSAAPGQELVTDGRKSASMFLKDVESISPPSPYFDLVAASLARLSHEIMHEDAPIGVALRELIAAYTSSLNCCEFCMKAHAAVAAHLYKDESLVWSVLRDLEHSALPEKEKAILRFVRKVTLESGSIDETDIAALHAAGWDDTSIFYAIAACALFNFYNRFVSANGVKPVSDEAFRRLASRMAEKGYVRE